MPKRKAGTLSQPPAINGTKRVKHITAKSVPAIEKPNLLDDSSSEGSEDESDQGGASLEAPGFKINEDYAKRFEYNKKREELHRLEEKYQKEAKPTKDQYGDKYDEDSDSSDDEDEDDEGFLATEALDAEISATLQAIRSKDPRVYDEKVTFYAPIDEDGKEQATAEKIEKPIYLRDYHRENLLKGQTEVEEEDDDAPRTFAQEQDDLKHSIVKEMHAVAAADSSKSASDDNSDDDGGFLIPKTKTKVTLTNGAIHPSRASKVKVDVDIAVADKDPETFLSNFMAARAWVPGEGSRFQPLESDDDEEVERADAFEAAYNLRFEDPKASNEMLKSYARDVVAAKSVRREEPNTRKKIRDAQREKKEAGKREREEEKARMRRLKIDGMEEMLKKIKKAAGIQGKTLKDEEWTKFLDEGWDNDKWDEEMNKRFGEEYYAEEEAGDDNDSEAEAANGSKKKKPKKPKWDDDIDINDVVPEFEMEEEMQQKPTFTLSDSENESDNDEASGKKSKSSKARKEEKLAKRKAARIERKKLEEFVDSKLDIDSAMAPVGSSKQPTLFRYRETSPTSFGLTARDILMAPDSSLNQFAGLKKMAAFRDADKKRKDKKHLGKKARLRQWRKETFGNENGPAGDLGDGITAPNDANADNGNGVDIVEGKKKKKRSRKTKVSGVAA